MSPSRRLASSARFRSVMSRTNPVNIARLPGSSTPVTVNSTGNSEPSARMPLSSKRLPRISLVPPSCRRLSPLGAAVEVPAG